MKVYTKFNWANGQSLEVPQEDILKVRPAPIGVEALLLLEIDPPNWASKAICKLGGKRHTKREVQQPHWPSKPWAGPLASLPNKDADSVEVYNRAISRRRKRQSDNNTPAASKVVPRGNLREDDYRFWKGFAADEIGDGAQCRWCLGMVHGRLEMQEHLSSRQCKEYLLALYRFAKTYAQMYCLACKAQTYTCRWGLPLCNRPACIGRWKFNFNHYLLGFVQYRTWAEEAQEADPTKGPYGHLLGDRI